VRANFGTPAAGCLLLAARTQTTTTAFAVQCRPDPGGRGLLGRHRTGPIPQGSAPVSLRSATAGYRHFMRRACRPWSARRAPRSRRHRARS
jgi:hypothetical protein